MEEVPADGAAVVADNAAAAAGGIAVVDAAVVAGSAGPGAAELRSDAPDRLPKNHTKTQNYLKVLK